MLVDSRSTARELAPDGLSTRRLAVASPGFTNVIETGALAAQPFFGRSAKRSQGDYMRRLIVVLALLFFLATRARAQCSASAVLNWSAASFSGTVNSVPLPGNSYASLSEAVGWTGSGPGCASCFGGGDNTLAGWVNTGVTKQIGTGSSLASTSSSQLSAMSTGSAGESFYAQVERSGSIVATNGTVTISIPYTFTFGTGCSSNSAGASIALWSATPGQLISSTMAGGTAAASIILWTITPGQLQGLFLFTVVNPTGTLTLSVSNLQPGGTYYFDIGAGSSAVQ